MRAEYGKSVLQELSSRLIKDFGKVFCADIAADKEIL